MEKSKRIKFWFASSEFEKCLKELYKMPWNEKVVGIQKLKKGGGHVVYRGGCLKNGGACSDPCSLGT